MTAGTSLDYRLILGIIRRESIFEYDAISAVGAVGLMQLMPATGRQAAKRAGMDGFQWEDLMRPEVNLQLGIAHFQGLLRRYDGELIPAIASYNASAHIVAEWIKRYSLNDELEFIEAIEFTETRNYVKKVLEAYWIYQLLYGKATAL